MLQKEVNSIIVSLSKTPMGKGMGVPKNREERRKYMSPKPHSTQVAKIHSSQISPLMPSDVLRKEVLDLRNALERGYMKLAKLLSEVRHQELYVKWGFTTFADYLDKELGFDERKAEHLINIWDKVKGFKLDEERIKKIGWTKMRQITPVLTEKNSKDLINKAEKLSARSLGEKIKSLRAIEKTPPQILLKLPLEDSEYRIIMDAIEEAKKLTKQSASQALQMVCLDWMEDKGARPELASLEDHIKYVERVYGVRLKFNLDRKAA